MIYVNEDITETSLLYVAHGCNNQGVFNKGVAKAIREKWPQAYKNYMQYYETTELGNFIDAFIPGDDKVILNLMTQGSYGNSGVHASYFHIIKSLEAVIERYSMKKIAISRIGCSLGGLHWEIMSVLLRELEVIKDVEFHVYHKED